MRVNWDRTAPPFHMPGAVRWFDLHVGPEPGYPFGRRGLAIARAWEQLGNRKDAGMLMMDGDVAIDPLDLAAMGDAIAQTPKMVLVGPVRLWPASTMRESWVWGHWKAPHGPTQEMVPTGSGSGSPTCPGCSWSGPSRPGSRTGRSRTSTCGSATPPGGTGSGRGRSTAATPSTCITDIPRYNHYQNITKNLLTGRGIARAMVIPDDMFSAQAGGERDGGGTGLSAARTRDLRAGPRPHSRGAPAASGVLGGTGPPRSPA
jgi:hypothetical protein